MDSTFEMYIREAWAKIYSSGQNWNANDAENPAVKYAAEFFDYFKAHPTTETGIKAATQAFMLWGNLGSIEEIEKALPHIANDSEVWRMSVLMIGNAYFRSNRTEDYKSLVEQLAEDVTHPGSCSQIVLVMANLCNKEEEKARGFYQKVIELNAHPFDVEKAKGALYEMDLLQVGAIAPSVSFRTIDGTTIEMSALRGKTVLLEFWGMRCGPCLPDIPRLKQLYKTLPPSEFQLIGITDDSDLDALRAFMEKQGMDWPQVLEPVKRKKDSLILGPARSNYNVYQIPRSFLIDRDGKLVAKDLRGEKLVTVTTQAVKNVQKG